MCFDKPIMSLSKTARSNHGHLFEDMTKGELTRMVALVRPLDAYKIRAVINNTTYSLAHQLVAALMGRYDAAGFDVYEWVTGKAKSARHLEMTGVTFDANGKIDLNKSTGVLDTWWGNTLDEAPPGTLYVQKMYRVLMLFLAQQIMTMDQDSVVKLLENCDDDPENVKVESNEKIYALYAVLYEREPLLISIEDVRNALRVAREHGGAGGRAFPIVAPHHDPRTTDVALENWVVQHYGLRGKINVFSSVAFYLMWIPWPFNNTGGELPISQTRAIVIYGLTGAVAPRPGARASTFSVQGSSHIEAAALHGPSAKKQ